MKIAVFASLALLTGCAHQTRVPTGHECHGRVYHLPDGVLVGSCDPLESAK